MVRTWIRMDGARVGAKCSNCGRLAEDITGWTSQKLDGSAPKPTDGDSVEYIDLCPECSELWVWDPLHGALVDFFDMAR